MNKHTIKVIVTLDVVDKNRHDEPYTTHDLNDIVRATCFGLGFEGDVRYELSKDNLQLVNIDVD